jgi:hypothetical protein
MSRTRTSTVLFLVGLTISACAAQAESFDKPVQKKVVDLGPSPYLGPNNKNDPHIKLTCSYYPTFMVKELNDPGNKGALFISTVPIEPGHTPACTKNHGPNERVFKDWDGYFAGVKRGLLFLDASDGSGGGMPFAVFNPATGAKIFEDSVKLENGGQRKLDFVQTSGAQITLRYLRVVTEDCSLPKDGAACWDRFRNQIGLTSAPVPACNYGGEDPQAYSVIAYPVETAFFPKPSTKALANPATCWPHE